MNKIKVIGHQHQRQQRHDHHNSNNNNNNSRKMKQHHELRYHMSLFHMSSFSISQAKGNSHPLPLGTLGSKCEIDWNRSRELSILNYWVAIQICEFVLGTLYRERNINCTGVCITSAKPFANGSVVTHDHIWQRGARLFAANPVSPNGFGDLHLLCEEYETYTVHIASKLLNHKHSPAIAL